MGPPTLVDVKQISVGQLRQNPTEMLRDVEAGETYEITRHGHVIAHVTPPLHSGGELRPDQLLPERRKGTLGQWLAAAPPLTRTYTREEVDAIHDEMKGDW